MTLSDRQFQFAKDMVLLEQYCINAGLKFTYGEAYRTDYQHAENVRNGISKAERSKHQDRLAKDLNFFIDGLSIYSMPHEQVRRELQHVGDFWEAIREGNVWGGNWTDPFDPAHFQS